jgi:hypothetical protein
MYSLAKTSYRYPSTGAFYSIFSKEVEEAKVGWHSDTILEVWLHNTAFDKEELAC